MENGQPEEQEETVSQEEQERIERLDGLGMSLAKMRSDAIQARRTSGIEDEWKEAEEQYDGIDDANRSQSYSIDSRGAFSSSTQQNTATRSTVFVPITRPYTDAASARVCDMLLPTDERNFKVENTPVPESLTDMTKGKLKPEHQQQIESRFQGQPTQVAQAINELKDSAEKLIRDMRAKSEKAETRIEDWFIEGQYYSEIRKVIEDASKYGTGIIKGPYPVKRKASAVLTEGGTAQIIMREDIFPESKRVNPWNLYPDPNCGEDIHRGSFIFERDTITKKELRNLIGVEGYIESQIRECLKEGPIQATSEVRGEFENESGSEKPFEIWYFQGVIDKEDMEAAGCECGDREFIDASITMVNNRVVKAIHNPLDTGEFIYDVMVWQRRPGRWFGIGVPKQIETPQRIVNAATRNMMDNAGVAAGGIFVYKQGSLEPVDGKWTLGPRKFFALNESSDLNDARQALHYIEIPIRQNELGQIIQFALKMAEDVTGLPMILQGQQGKAPDTLGGMQLLNNNANAVLRRIARTFDDRITEPHVRRYYAWLLQYGEDDDEKGDFQIYARGSSALVERDAQTQFMVQSLQYVLKAPPTVTGIDAKKFLRELYKSQRLDTSNFFYTDEEMAKVEQKMAKMQQMAKPQAQDPRAEIAKIKAEMMKQLQDMEQKFEAQENDKDRQLELFLAQMEQKIEEMKLSGERVTNFDDIKAEMAKVAMQLRTQRALGAIRPQVARPPTEPPGRAPKGMAYQR